MKPEHATPIALIAALAAATSGLVGATAEGDGLNGYEGEVLVSVLVPIWLSFGVLSWFVWRGSRRAVLTAAMVGLAGAAIAAWWLSYEQTEWIGKTVGVTVVVLCLVTSVAGFAHLTRPRFRR